MLDIKNNKYTIYQISSMLKNGTLESSNAIQRPAGQWTKSAKQLLIQSLLVGYPVPPFYIITSENEIEKNGKKKRVYSLLDGQQRATTIADYLNDKFSLKDDFEDVSIDDEDHKIAGLKYSELDEEVKQNLLAVSLTFTFVDNLTNEEIEEMFFRLNSGKPLSAIQKAKAKIGIDQLKKIDFLINHKLMSKIPFTAAQIKNSANLKLVIEAFEALNIKSDDDMPAFKMRELTKVAAQLNTKPDDELNSDTDKINNAFNILYSAIDDNIFNKKRPAALKMDILPLVVTNILKTNMNVQSVNNMLLNINDSANDKK